MTSKAGSCQAGCSGTSTKLSHFYCCIGPGAQKCPSSGAQMLFADRCASLLCWSSLHLIQVSAFCAAVYYWHCALPQNNRPGQHSFGECKHWSESCTGDVFCWCFSRHLVCALRPGTVQARTRALGLSDLYPPLQAKSCLAYAGIQCIGVPSVHSLRSVIQSP